MTISEKVATSDTGDPGKTLAKEFGPVKLPTPVPSQPLKA
jgi:hypothetical protein